MSGDPVNGLDLAGTASCPNKHLLWPQRCKKTRWRRSRYAVSGSNDDVDFYVPGNTRLKIVIHDWSGNFGYISVKVNGHEVNRAIAPGGVMTFTFKASARQRGWHISASWGAAGFYPDYVTGLFTAEASVEETYYKVE